MSDLQIYLTVAPLVLLAIGIAVYLLRDRILH